jgi:glycosyltransferase involved in cell wall biosynthesis
MRPRCEIRGEVFLSKKLLIIPTYNESENIRALVEKVRERVPDMHVLIIDDNSPDGTGRIADQLASEYEGIRAMHREGKLGLGSAYVAGFKQALADGYDLICQMDADFSHDPSYWPDLLRGMDGHDVMIGSRYVPGGGTRNWGIHRRLLSRASGFVARLVLGIKVRDCTGGFRCYKRHVIEKIDPGTIFSNGYSFIEEVLYKAVKAGAVVGETPIIFVERERGKSKISKKEIFKAVVTLFRLRFGKSGHRIT